MIGKPTTPLRIAHRGNTRDFPENTLAAFRSALDLGADGIEFDVHLDKNGEIIVVHNYLFDHTQTFPTLDEVLEAFGQQGRMEIEVKELNVTILPQIRRAIERHHITDFELTTSVVPLVSHIRREFPKARIGLIFRRNLIEDWMTPDFRAHWIYKNLELAGANVLHLDLDLYTVELATYLHQRKITLHTHLKIASQADWQRMKQLGIDQCTFDDPETIKL